VVVAVVVVVISGTVASFVLGSGRYTKLVPSRVRIRVLFSFFTWR
jgi:hypothetical protein